MYRRLLNVVDDYGRFDGRASVIRATAFPVKLEQVREADVQRGLAACHEAGLVRLYEVDGKPFIEVLNFGQQIRAKSSKYPTPPGSCEAPESKCLAHAKQVLTDAEHMRTQSYSYSETKSNSTDRQTGGRENQTPPNPPKRELNHVIAAFRTRVGRSSRFNEERDLLDLVERVRQCAVIIDGIEADPETLVTKSIEAMPDGVGKPIPYLRQTIANCRQENRWPGSEKRDAQHQSSDQVKRAMEGW